MMRKAPCCVVIQALFFRCGNVQLGVCAFGFAVYCGYAEHVFCAAFKIFYRYGRFVGFYGRRVFPALAAV